ncbi:hypothetical protein HYALB_00004742 [Hymenoscyphus albidus]|uniref:Small secreted protein n=1 Tax=Hymenoscyphus albidus TaxID=595503 RepID=A0A9N9LV78_9HELO|nr:hypothetical protein HYALB_00004742 [Hymenoscyphus albidus]
MHFSLTASLTLALVALTVATPLPAPKTSTKTKSAKASSATKDAAADAAGGASVLTAGQTYNDIQISSGTAGDAESLANALFANIDQSNLAGVSAADLKIIKATHDVAEDAEVDGFNKALEGATGDEKVAIQNGKIKNKVLKLTAEVLALQVENAQGNEKGDVAAEQKKLANNIALDTKAKGGASTAVPFDGTIG